MMALNLIYQKIIHYIFYKLIKYREMSFSSIENNQTQYLQQQIKDLLQITELRGRLSLGSTQEFSWQDLKCIVPLFVPFSTQGDLTTINIVLKCSSSHYRSVAGIFVEATQIPKQFWFRNLRQDVYFGAKHWSTKQIVLSIVDEIDKAGLLEWAEKIQRVLRYNNKLNFSQNQKVNQFKQNIQAIKNKNNNIQNNLDIKQGTTADNSIEDSNSNKLGSSHQEQINYNILIPPLIAKNKQPSQLLPLFPIDQPKFRPDSSCLIKPIPINISKYENKQEDNEGLQINNMLISPFSSFKPIVKDCEKQKKRDAQMVKNEQKYRLGFTKCLFTGKKANHREGNRAFSDIDKEQNFQMINHLLEKNEGSGENMQELIKVGEKHSKQPKPMNKNANLPKFLIRIFIKYIDKFKSMYLKKEYDKLYTECRKMKEWKKNDRRQHAFGLKHLKIFFQDVIEGFPQPILNRKVISKIIDHYLLEEICQNSQIPQSHRVGYLVACRVYSIRCRNASLAGRIQSK